MSDAPDKEHDGGGVEEGFCGDDESFEVFGEPAVSIDPGDSHRTVSVDNPDRLELRRRGHVHRHNNYGPHSLDRPRLQRDDNPPGLRLIVSVGGRVELRAIRPPPLNRLAALRRKWRNYAATARIRELNDAFRKTFSGGKVMMTVGVAALPDIVRANALVAVAHFDRFTADNDPYGEHDFGSFELVGRKFFFKIDCYDENMEFGSEDPADSKKTPACSHSCWPKNIEGRQQLFGTFLFRPAVARITFAVVPYLAEVALCRSLQWRSPFGLACSRKFHRQVARHPLQRRLKSLC